MINHFKHFSQINAVGVWAFGLLWKLLYNRTSICIICNIYWGQLMLCVCVCKCECTWMCVLSSINVKSYVFISTQLPGEKERISGRGHWHTHTHTHTKWLVCQFCPGKKSLFSSLLVFGLVRIVCCGAGRPVSCIDQTFGRGKAVWSFLGKVFFIYMNNFLLPIKSHR